MHGEKYDDESEMDGMKLTQGKHVVGSKYKRIAKRSIPPERRLMESSSPFSNSLLQ